MGEVQDYEFALASRSRGLVRGRGAWHEGLETWLIDFPLVVLVVNRLRTTAARRFQAASLEQSLLLMSGREEVAKSMAQYWRRERMCRPDNALLQFVGAAVGHELPPTTGSSSPSARLQTRPPPADQESIARMCAEQVARSMPELLRAVLGTVTSRFEQALRDSQARQAEWMDNVLAELRRPSNRQIVNVNTSHRETDDQERINLEVADEQDAARIRLSALPVSRFVKQQWRGEWAAVPYTSFVGTPSCVYCASKACRPLRNYPLPPLLQDHGPGSAGCGVRSPHCSTAAK